MSNVFYSGQLTRETVFKTLGAFIDVVSAKRPGFKFVFSASTECLVYHETADFTCKDRSSHNYVGTVRVGGGSYRGGKGYRYSIMCVPYGVNAAACVDTVVQERAVKEFMRTFLRRSEYKVVEDATDKAVSRIKQAVSNSRHTLLDHFRVGLNDLRTVDLVTDPHRAIEATIDKRLVEDSVIQARDHLRKVFSVYGSSLERLACVVPIKDSYYVRHAGATVGYNHEALPAHIACALGILKILGTHDVVVEGHGVSFADGTYAVSITEVEV